MIVTPSWHDDIHIGSDLRSAEFERPREIVPELLNEGETGVFAGRPKMGKSRLTIQMAVALSRGTKFLGREVAKRHKVLVLDLENRPSVVQDRFTKMSSAHKDDNMIMFYSPKTLAESVVSLENEGLKQLRDMVLTTEPGVLVIDTWRLLIGATDENRGEIVLRGLTQLSQLRIDMPKMAIILVHHLRKQSNAGLGASLKSDPHTWVESVSGHHALVGHVDFVWGLDREITGDGEELIVFGGVARNASCTSIMLEEDADSLLFSVASGEDALKAFLTAVECKMWEAAQSLKRPFRFGDLLKAADSKNKKAAASMLRKAEANSVIEKLSDGCYRILV
jgi:hypothetical protein